MPVGLEHPVLGYLAFCGVKAVGYTAAATVISRIYDRTDLNSLGVGSARTLIGMATGAALFGVMQFHVSLPPIQPPYSQLIVLGVLSAVRIAEWWLLIWLFYDRYLCVPRQGWIVAVLGVIWSFTLDIPALLGWMVAGGFWVC